MSRMVVKYIAALLCFGYVSSKVDFDPLHDECGFKASERKGCGRKHDALGELECKVRGCCFDDSRDIEAGVPRCFLAHRMLQAKCDVAYEDKDDCGYFGMLEGECLTRGCCWRPSPNFNDPSCFMPRKGGLKLVNYNSTEVNPREGLVVVEHDGIEGTICDDDFDDFEARVVCRQLGFFDGVARCCAEFGAGDDDQQIWLDSLQCNGSEESLDECPHDPWGENDCSHGEDASVICYNEGDPVPTYAPPEYYYYTDDVEIDRAAGKNAFKNEKRKRIKTKKSLLERVNDLLAKKRGTW